MSKGGGQPASTTQTTTTEFPSELRPYITDILERAKSRAESQESQGFQPYTGPRIAEREAEQVAAEAGTKGILAGGVATSPVLSSAQTYYTPALGLTLGQAEQFGAPQAAQYMSPYQQAVIDVEKREAMRGFQPQIQQIGAQAARAGGFGGSRQAILEAEAQRNLNQQLGDIQTRGLQAAYDRGQAAFEAQKARERGAATALSQMGAAIPGQALKEVGALEALGATKRADTQRALDLAYGQFMEEQTYPTKTLQEYQSIIRGFPFTPSTYQSSTAITPPASLAQNILGIGTGIAGLYGAFGGFGAKSGGHLAKLQEAGKVGDAEEDDNPYQGFLPRLMFDLGLTSEAAIAEERERDRKAQKLAEEGLIDSGFIVEKKVEKPQESVTSQGTDGSDTGAEAPVTTTPPSTEPPKSEGAGTAGDIAALLNKGSYGLYESKLTDLLSQIEGRETLTPEMKALKERYGKLAGELGDKRAKREEELKKQKYLQLAEFGRGLLGADTTKGLLAQVGEAGEKPLKELGAIMGKEAELEDKQTAEELAILGKQAEIAQGESKEERQKISDTLSVTKSMVDIQKAKNDAAGMESTWSESLIKGVYDTLGLNTLGSNDPLMQDVLSITNEVLEDVRRGVLSKQIADDNAAVSIAVRQRLNERLSPIASKISGRIDGGTAAVANSGASASSTLKDMRQ